jgi:diguanylate cyclase (GGDEF)-like protein
MSVEIAKDRSFLAKVGICSLLSEPELEKLSGFLAPVELADGEVLFREGEEGRDLYIIREGTVAIAIGLPDGSEHEVARVSAGNFFGDMSIFDNAPRSATCRAVGGTALWGLSKEAFARIVSSHPRIAYKLMFRMLNIATQRLRGTGTLVSEMVLWGENARKRAITDELTGVYNRRFLEDSLDGYVAEAAEKGTPLSLAMTDLDYFRKINEAYGHAKADEAIREASRIYRSLLRPTDIVARYGGDEFVLIFPGTAAPEALALAVTLCREVEKLPTFRDLGGPITTVTVSMGVASFPEHARDLAGLKAAADAALYKAKEAGRNRAVGAGEGR